MPKASAPPTALSAPKSEKSQQISGLLPKIKDSSEGGVRDSVFDVVSNKEGAIDRADFERLAAAIKEEAVADYEAKQAMVAKLGRSKNRVRYFGAAAGCLCIEGVEMLFEQGCAQCEIWTHRPAPRGQIARGLEVFLNSKDFGEMPGLIADAAKNS